MLQGANVKPPGHTDCTRLYRINGSSLDDSIRDFDNKHGVDSNHFDPNGIRYKILQKNKICNWALVPDDQR